MELRSRVVRDRIAFLLAACVSVGAILMRARRRAGRSVLSGTRAASYHIGRLRTVATRGATGACREGSDAVLARKLATRVMHMSVAPRVHAFTGVAAFPCARLLVICLRSGRSSEAQSCSELQQSALGDPRQLSLVLLTSARASLAPASVATVIA